MFVREKRTEIDEDGDLVGPITSVLTSEEIIEEVRQGLFQKAEDKLGKRLLGVRTVYDDSATNKTVSGFEISTDGLELMDELEGFDTTEVPFGSERIKVAVDVIPLQWGYN